MRKTWFILGLAALMALPLTGCGDNRTGGHTGTASPSPTVQATMPGGEGDLADGDGIVGNDGAGNTGNDNADGRADDSPLERMGEGVRDTLDDMGDAARDVAQDAKRAMTR